MEQDRDEAHGPEASVDARTRQGVVAWASAGQALAAVRRRELATMSEAEARQAVADLLALVADLPAKDGDSGLVEQQRRFARLR